MFVSFYNKTKPDIIEKIQLDFDKESNSFIYKIYGRLLFDGDFANKRCVTGWWYGKIIIVNSETGKLLRCEDYKIYKSATLM